MRAFAPMCERADMEPHGRLMASKTRLIVEAIQREHRKLECPQRLLKRQSLSQLIKRGDSLGL